MSNEAKSRPVSEIARSMTESTPTSLVFSTPREKIPDSPRGRTPKRYVAEITIHHATHLVSTDLLTGTCDPYVIISCEDFDEFSTEVKSRTCAPVWNETRKMVLSSMTPMKVVGIVYDRNIFTADEPLGRFQFTIGENGKDWTGDKVFPLERVTASTQREVQRNGRPKFGKIRISWSMAAYHVTTDERRKNLLLAVGVFCRVFKSLTTPLTIGWSWVMWSCPTESAGILLWLLYMVLYRDVAACLPFLALGGLVLTYFQRNRTNVSVFGEIQKGAPPSQPPSEFTVDVSINFAEIVVAVLDFVHDAVSRRPQGVFSSPSYLIGCIVIVLTFIDLSRLFLFLFVVFLFTVPLAMASPKAIVTARTVSAIVVQRFYKLTSPLTVLSDGPPSMYRSTSVYERRKTLCRFRFETDVCGEAPVLTARVLVDQVAIPLHIFQRDDATPPTEGSHKDGALSHRNRTHTNPPQQQTHHLSTEHRSTVCLRCKATFGFFRKRKTCSGCAEVYCKDCVHETAGQDIFTCVSCRYISRHCGGLCNPGLMVRMQMSELSQSSTLQAPTSTPLPLDDLVRLSRLRDALGGDTAVLQVKLLGYRPLTSLTVLEFHDAAIPLGAIRGVFFDNQRLRMEGRIFQWPFVLRCSEDSDSVQTREFAKVMVVLRKMLTQEGRK